MRFVRRFRNWFWVASVVVFAGLTATGGYWAHRMLPEPIVKWMLDTDIQTQAQLWQRRILSQISSGAGAFEDQQLSDADLEFLRLVPNTSDIYRMKLVSDEGLVFWSTRPEDIGSTLANSKVRAAGISGEFLLEASQKDASEIDGLAIHSLEIDTTKRHLVYEVYTPVFQDGAYVGTLVFFKDVTGLHDVLYERVDKGVTYGALALILVMLGTAVFMVRTSRNQMRRIDDRNSEEREILENQMQLAKEVKLLGELNEWLQSSRSLDELFDMVIKFMSHMLPECAGSIYVYSNSRDVLDGVSSWNDGVVKRHIHPEACWGLRRGRTYTYGTSEVDFICEHAEPHDDSPYFCFPVLAHGETVGLMHLKKRPDVSDHDFLAVRKLAQMCAEQISMAIANVRMRDQLQEQSIRDPLTGLFNRRHMIDRLRHLVDLSGDRTRAVHVIYLDLDHFKRFNDTHGHDAGDYVLRAVGEVLDASCSDDEVACRMGGEEFVILWPDLADAELKHRLDALRSKITGLSLNYQTKNLPKVTASIGVASSPQHGTLPQDILRAADEAMYDAKNNGRDRIVFAGHPSRSATAPLVLSKDEALSEEEAKPSKGDIAAE
ncbi:diguanylate cyclase [Cognatishimia activa]|uniref:sensor domain-containing diguanylate cyclase n=1 Tax=Cognatishimia activa TaxID=1715691 RepID=UPI0022303406|nr:diguanylate cyclase [Cognatishimia activa]UZD89684.1 diguanylate cyclase [Cognatishimia activa]